MNEEKIRRAEVEFPSTYYPGGVPLERNGDGPTPTKIGVEQGDEGEGLVVNIDVGEGFVTIPRDDLNAAIRFSAGEIVSARH